MLRLSTAVTFALMLLFGMASAPTAWAGAPTDQLREGIERIFKTLADPAMSGDEKATQRRTTVARITIPSPCWIRSIW